MAVNKPAHTTDPNITLENVFLFAHFDTFGVQRAGEFAKERFRHFFNGSEGAANTTFDTLKNAWKLPGVNMSHSSAQPTDFKVLHALGLISDNAMGVARDIYFANGRVAMDDRQLYIYSIKSAHEDDGSGSSIGFNTTATIDRIIGDIETGKKRNFQNDVASKTSHGDKAELHARLSPAGVKELLGLKDRIAAIKAALPTKEGIAQMRITDTMLRAADEALGRLGFTSEDKNTIFSRTARTRLARISRQQQHPARAHRAA